MGNLRFLDVALMEGSVTRRRRTFLRGKRRNRFPLSGRLENNYIVIREDGNTRKRLNNERSRLLKEKEQRKNNVVDGIDRIPTSESNYEMTISNSPLDNPLLESKLSSPPSRPPISEYVNEFSGENHLEIIDNQSISIDNHMDSAKDAIIVLLLAILLVILVVNMVILIYEPAFRCVKRKLQKFIAENPTLIERRYKTIDKWLIQKVRRENPVRRTMFG